MHRYNDVPSMIDGLVESLIKKAAKVGCGHIKSVLNYQVVFDITKFPVLQWYSYIESNDKIIVSVFEASIASNVLFPDEPDILTATQICEKINPITNTMLKELVHILYADR